MRELDEKLASLSAGARQNPEASNAQPAHAYLDPAITARYEAETYGVKQIENLLRSELDNWIRWGRRKDWLPRSFKCPLGFLYKSPDVFGGLPHRPPPCDELEAERFERIVCALPPRMRTAFVMYQLDRAHVSGHVVVIQGRKRKADILGVSVGQYHYLVRQAHRMLYAEWRKARR